MAWIVLKLFFRSLYKKHIWLICEKRSEARDNGMHFFRYCKINHPDKNVYYVIEKDSVDIGAIEEFGSIIYSDSFKHCLYYLAAERDISSQAYGAYPFNLFLNDIRRMKLLCNRNRKTVFLQHGIIKDELSHKAFDYNLSGIDFFVTSSHREYSFIKDGYGYPDKAIGCVGLCRFDRLYKKKDIKGRIILIMPTWRYTLKRIKNGVSLSEMEKQLFLNSDYCRSYRRLLSDELFLTLLKTNGYKLVFYMHFQMQDYTPLMEDLQSDSVIIANRYEYDVQALLMNASLLITDYSSVFFDFGYMNRPVVYYQFDESDFRKTQYSEGYFDYSRDGFGPCAYSHTELIRDVTDIINNQMIPFEMYQNRIDSFFAYRDDHNCERTYSRIVNL